MSRVSDSLLRIRELEGLSEGDSPVHGLHPLAKLAATLLYLVAVTSFPNKEVSRLLPFALFPIVVASAAELPARPILARLLFASPLILGIGALNPFFDRALVAVGPFAVPGGWLVFASLALKGALTASAAIILVGTTGAGGVGEALLLLGLPRIFVTQFLLTFRYLSLLMEETARVLRAHELRSLGRRGIGKEARGSLPGGVLVRTYERGMRVYEAMRLRGFSGDLPREPGRRLGARDLAYLVSWAAVFFVLRTADLPEAIGSFLIKAAAR